MLKGIDKNAGQFRTRGLIVFRDLPNEQDRTIEKLATEIGKRGGIKKKKTYLKLIERARKEQKEPLDIANETEMEALRPLGYIPPKTDKVPEKMKQFARDLRRMSQQMDRCEDFDPVGFAAFAHSKVGEIHPFQDANGRMGRLMMNGILKKGGYQPVVFSNDDVYTDAVTEDEKKPGAFADFLRNTAMPEVEREFDSQKECIEGLSCD